MPKQTDKCYRFHVGEEPPSPPPSSVSQAEETHMGRCVCCDCSSGRGGGAGLREGARGREREVGGGVCLFLLCFLMVTAPPEEGERDRERGTEMMENEGRWLAV